MSVRRLFEPTTRPRGDATEELGVPARAELLETHLETVEAELAVERQWRAEAIETFLALRDLANRSHDDLIRLGVTDAAAHRVLDVFAEIAERAAHDEPTPQAVDRANDHQEASPR
jgi:hypothetical protein